MAYRHARRSVNAVATTRIGAGHYTYHVSGRLYRVEDQRRLWPRDYPAARAAWRVSRNGLTVGYGHTLGHAKDLCDQDAGRVVSFRRYAEKGSGS